MTTCTILVVGATGQQGSAVIDALAELAPAAPDKIKVLALTRNASSQKAQALATKHTSLYLDVIEGNVLNPEPIFDAHPEIQRVFSFTSPPNEVPQATALIDASIKAGVSHFVFSSVERGGDEKSWTNPTQTPHFAEKHEIELYLRDQCNKHKTDAEKGMTWTILRPTAFMDNFNPTSPFGAAFAALLSTMPASQKLQVVSVRDIGRFAAKALLNPKAFAGRAIGLAGDEITLGDARATYRRVTEGLELPQAWWIVGKGLRWAINDVGRMFDWFESDGYGVDIAALRKEEPELQDLEKWLKESSRFDCGLGK
ncbi:uncharacterized protein B0I36DRAFT_235009 [Microdochium trichocladiopsis]|uniref:NmrA-like domain-containing protein n=1 Tax=Microdochium trichocladiopsis TaxID=1682393 RepID=A0A9P8YIH8_9PEZI|nr:uncharacterized protein B0I36DRAFT_235009 [Microdochium trichocladiopsis]KAH7040563.1 hypothetical protein B0I36DRAFT_235009 [Microdochium trichocladiopsis]